MKESDEEKYIFFFLKCRQDVKTKKKEKEEDRTNVLVMMMKMMKESVRFE